MPKLTGIYNWPGLLTGVLVMAATARAGVRIERLPEGALQPQAVTDAAGTTHLIYLVGAAEHSDIRYVRRRVDETHWSAPLRVNSQPGSALAIGTIRGAQLAAGRDGRAHVCWNGSELASPKGPRNSAPLLYARLNDAGDAFEPQRNLMTNSRGLDGGGSLAADGEGRIFVVWHGFAAGSGTDERDRAVFLALSTDDGRTFAGERAISPPGSGACGCCGLKAFAAGNGDVFVLYRAARSLAERDMTLLGSRDHGQKFNELLVHPWPVGACPMSSASLAGVRGKTAAAWETGARIYTATVAAGDAGRTSTPRTLGSREGAKHPFITSNQRGEMLVTWAEGTGWGHGGDVAWQVLNADGAPVGDQGGGSGLVTWSFATAFAQPDGDFVILY